MAYIPDEVNNKTSSSEAVRIRQLEKQNEVEEEDINSVHQSQELSSVPAENLAATEAVDGVAGQPRHPLFVREHYHLDTLGHVAERLCSCPLNAPPHRYVCAPCVDTRADLHAQQWQEWSDEFPLADGWYWMRGFRQYRPLPVEIQLGRLSMMFGTGHYSQWDVKGAEFMPLPAPPNTQDTNSAEGGHTGGCNAGT